MDIIFIPYLKNVFPTVEETVLLDLLCNSENNVQKVTETLAAMGFTKKTNAGTKIGKEDKPYSSKKALNSDSVYIPLRDPSPRMKSNEEKAGIKGRLEEKYKKIAKQIVTLALEAADFDEERAEQFLNSIAIEDAKTDAKGKYTVKSESEKIDADYDNPSVKTFRDSGIWEKTSPDTSDNKSSINSSSSSPNEFIKTKNISDFKSLETSTFSPADKEHPQIPKTAHAGPENIFRMGLKLKTKIIPKGSNKALLGQRYIPKGPNPKLQKGSCKGLAKGSMYTVPSELVPPLCSNDVRRSECIIF